LAPWVSANLGAKTGAAHTVGKSYTIARAQQKNLCHRKSLANGTAIADWLGERAAGFGRSEEEGCVN
jgi:hypothetical protein